MPAMKGLSGRAHS